MRETVGAGAHGTAAAMVKAADALCFEGRVKKLEWTVSAQEAFQNA
jgi:hypothetical protein